MTNLHICKWENCSLPSFNSAEDLYNHLTSSHVGWKSQGTLSLTCKWKGCFTQTTKRDHITSHLRVHVTLKPFQCDSCEKSFKWIQDLKKHAKMHSPSAPPKPNKAIVPKTQQSNLLPQIYNSASITNGNFNTSSRPAKRELSSYGTINYSNYSPSSTSQSYSFKAFDPPSNSINLVQDLDNIAYKMKRFCSADQPPAEEKDEAFMTINKLLTIDPTKIDQLPQSLLDEKSMFYLNQGVFKLLPELSNSPHSSATFSQHETSSPLSSILTNFENTTAESTPVMGDSSLLFESLIRQMNPDGSVQAQSLNKPNSHSSNNSNFLDTLIPSTDIFKTPVNFDMSVDSFDLNKQILHSPLNLNDPSTPASNTTAAINKNTNTNVSTNASTNASTNTNFIHAYSQSNSNNGLRSTQNSLSTVDNFELFVNPELNQTYSKKSTSPTGSQHTLLDNFTVSNTVKPTDLLKSSIPQSDHGGSNNNLYDFAQQYSSNTQSNSRNSSINTNTSAPSYPYQLPSNTTTPASYTSSLSHSKEGLAHQSYSQILQPSNISPETEYQNQPSLPTFSSKNSNRNNSNNNKNIYSILLQFADSIGITLSPTQLQRLVELENADPGSNSAFNDYQHPGDTNALGNNTNKLDLQQMAGADHFVAHQSQTNVYAPNSVFNSMLQTPAPLSTTPTSSISTHTNISTQKIHGQNLVYTTGDFPSRIKHASGMPEVQQLDHRLNIRVMGVQQRTKYDQAEADLQQQRQYAAEIETASKTTAAPAESKPESKPETKERDYVDHKPSTEKEKEKGKEDIYNKLGFDISQVPETTESHGSGNEQSSDLVSRAEDSVITSTSDNVAAELKSQSYSSILGLVSGIENMKLGPGGGSTATKQEVQTEAGAGAVQRPDVKQVYAILARINYLYLLSKSTTLA